MTLSDFIEQVLAKTPEMAGLVLLVWMFLKFITKTMEAQTATYKELALRETATYRELATLDAEARKHSREVIERNTVAMASMTAALEHFAGIAKRCETNGNK